MKEKVIGRVPVHSDSELISAELADGCVHLELQRRDGGRDKIQVDHVIAATGYRTDVRRLDFLSRSLLSKLATAEHSPILSSNFESSVKGLFFVGPAAAASFGPLMRFAFGARFAARRVTRKLSSLSRPRTVVAAETLSPSATRS